MKEKVKNYLLENNINSEEQLATHILELRRNTFVKPILFELVDLLYNKKSVLLSFFAQKNSTKGILNFTELEKSIITEKEQEELSRKHIEKQKPFYLDEVMERIQNQQYTQTYSSGRPLDFHSYNYTEEEKKIFEDWNFKIVEYKNEHGVKTNKNKPQISLLFKQFPKALEAITHCSEYGHQKYLESDADYLNFSRVEGGSKTYADAGLRHRLKEGNDLESGLPHQYHVAWNALAELELWIKENS